MYWCNNWWTFPSDCYDIYIYIMIYIYILWYIYEYISVFHCTTGTRRLTTNNIIINNIITIVPFWPWIFSLGALTLDKDHVPLQWSVSHLSSVYYYSVRYTIIHVTWSHTTLQCELITLLQSVSLSALLCVIWSVISKVWNCWPLAKSKC